MKSVEFQGKLEPGGQITLPTALTGAIPAGEPLRVVLEWDLVSDEDAAWRREGLRQFEGAYCPEDAIYEQLNAATPIR